MKRDRERQLRREIGTLTAELAQARRDLERVTGQRDELRKVLGDVRSYARQEAERAVAENLSRRDAQVAMERRPSWAMHQGYEGAEAGRKMRPTVAMAAHLSDPEPPRTPLMGSCYHPAEDTSSEAFRHRCHGNHEPCPPGGHQ